jgi:sec-independent protein translocase protein TatC
VRIALWGGLILAFPVILWQIWRFVVPALHAKERKYAIPFILSSVVLFALGGTLAFLTIDKALEFLISWSGEDVQQAFQITRYVSLVGLMVAAFGIGFLFPVLLVFLQLVGVVSPSQLLKQWRVAIMAVFVLAAVITPSGDPVSLLLLSVPMSLLFFASVGVGFLVEKRRRRQQAAAAS